MTDALISKHAPDALLNARRMADASSPDDAVSPLSQLFGHIVALIDDEILIENLESLPTLEVRHFGIGRGEGNFRWVFGSFVSGKVEGRILGG